MAVTITLRPERYLGHTVHLLAMPKDHQRAEEYERQLRTYQARWSMCEAADRAEAVTLLIAEAEKRPSGRQEFTDEAIAAALAYLNHGLD